MAGIQHRDAAREVDQAAAFDVDDLRVRRALGIDRIGVAHAAGHRRHAALVQVGIAGHARPLCP
jgi:hypothetical protein